MENTQGNRSFLTGTTRFGNSLYGLPDIQLRRQYPGHEISLLNPLQETRFDETLVSALSRLDMNRDYWHRRLSDNLINNGVLALDSQETEQTNQNCLSLNLQNGDGSSLGSVGFQNCNFDDFVPGLDSTSNNFSQIRSNQNDYREGEPDSEFSILPSSRRNMFLNTVLPKNHAVSRPGMTIERDCSSLGGFRGNIVAFVKDQSKSSLLQRTMSDLTKEEIDIIFSEVIDRVCELMIDPSGNYVVQKLVELCSEEQRTQILLMLTKVDFQLVRICLNINGSRAVLKLLEKLSTPQQTLVATALAAGAVALTKDLNGHYVIQYCLKYFSDEDNKYLLNVVADNCYGIATDKSGCCVLQHCVEYSRGAQREHLVAGIIVNALLLAEDCYGNYVVQQILGLRVPQITANLLRQFERHYASLSCNKYGSNVVEKCLVESGKQQSVRIILELLASPNVSMLLMDPFGNYVIQSALSVSKGPVHDALRNVIKDNSLMMRSNIYGKKVLAWFDRRRLSYI